MNFFSSSTSRLIIPRWKRPGTQAVQHDTLSTTCKYASTEGRFSIIDKRHKESASMESSDSSSDDELDLKDKKTIFTGTRYDHYVSFRSSTATIASSQQQSQSGLKKGKQMNGSRFRIVPVESCYERGRWACCDFYNTEPTKQQRERRTSPLPLFSSSSSSLPTKSFKSTCKSSMVSPIDNVPHTAPPSDQQFTTFLFDFFDESDTGNHLPTKAHGNYSRTQQLSSNHLILQKKAAKILLENNADNENKPKSNVMETGLALSGRMTPVEMLNNFGLERSLTATYSDSRSILELLPGTISPIGNSKLLKSNAPIECEKVESSPAGGTVVAASGTGANTIIAIDGKIEQAMDLVKTHLMFAVREEVDVLRAKIMELEATILQLEAENTILREHVPVEILNKLSLQTTSPNSTTTAAAV